MPRYEFECKNNGCSVKVFEVRMSIESRDKETVMCPVCGLRGKPIMSTFGGKFGDTEKFHG